MIIIIINNIIYYDNAFKLNTGVGVFSVWPPSQVLAIEPVVVGVLYIYIYICIDR